MVLILKTSNSSPNSPTLTLDQSFHCARYRHVNFASKRNKAWYGRKVILLESCKTCCCNLEFSESSNPSTQVFTLSAIPLVLFHDSLHIFIRRFCGRQLLSKSSLFV